MINLYNGVACKNLNRNFIGIELDENYFKIAKERIENKYNELNGEDAKERIDNA